MEEYKRFGYSDLDNAMAAFFTLFMFEYIKFSRARKKDMSEEEALIEYTIWEKGMLQQFHETLHEEGYAISPLEKIPNVFYN